MNKFSKLKLEYSKENGMRVEGMASPYIRFCIGTFILLVGLGSLTLALSPLIKVIAPNGLM